MTLSHQQRMEIFELLINQIRRKLAEYNPETQNMPFHIRLLGKDRMALFSFIQSVNTTIGTSVFEHTAAIIARPHFKQVICQFKQFNNTIYKQAQEVIQSTMDDLTTARVSPDKSAETAKILSVAQSGTITKIKRPRIDLFVEFRDGIEYYFDLKSAKPNMGEFKGYKRTLLEWVAIRGAVNPNVKIHTMLAIPYNPYEPEPYQRWTLQGLFDLRNEILVAEEFWDFLGGKNAYVELLDIFEAVGIELRPEIDRKFSKLY